MPLCKNTDKKRYTGNENTPLGKGYSASVEELGKRMKGTDGNMYKVVKTKGGKRWMKITSKVKSPRMYGDISKMKSQYYPDSAEWEKDMADIEESRKESELTEEEIEEIREIERSVMREMKEMEDIEAKKLSRKGLLDTSRFQGAPVHRFEPKVQEIIHIDDLNDIGARAVRKKMVGNIKDYVVKLGELREETRQKLMIPTQYQYDDWGKMVKHLYNLDNDWDPREMAEKTFYEHGKTLDKYDPDEGSVSYLTDGGERRPAYKLVD